jgi:carbon storage regulator
MLVLSRKASQRLTIGTDIRITVVRIDRNQVRLGIEAPAGVAILRNELAPITAAPAALAQREQDASRIRSRRGPRPRD